MKKLLLNTIFPFIIGMAIFGAIAMFNQLNLFANTVSSKYPYGYYIMWGIYVLIGIFTFSPLIKMIFLPKALIRPYIYSPPDEKRKFYYEYKKRVLNEYNKNSDGKGIKSYVKWEDIKELEDANSINSIKIALMKVEAEMDKVADLEIKKYAKAVFTSTAISQNGTLDAIFILKLQIELIWKLAHIYNQKPRIKELLNVYTSVIANALAAAAMSEISIQEVVESMIRQVSGGLSSFVVKGLSKVIDSIFDGTCNALLSLRVGYLAKDYCKYSTEYDERESRKKSRENAIKAINEIGVKDVITNMIEREKAV